MLQKYANAIGADPEFFFERKGKVIESGEALKGFGGEIELSDWGKIIQDGFQGEFNPDAVTCRQSFAWIMAKLFDGVDEAGYTARLGAGYQIPVADFAELSDRSKTFGCVPSENVYGREALGVNPKKYMFRPAGGHIHLSLSDKVKKNLPQLVKLLDIFVGNTCVPFDQDPLQAKRRENYGRAGEFRAKKYGVEYRTPSNFWLEHYVYLSMIFGLARQAISIAEYDPKAVDGLINLFPNDEIEKAINTNDKDLAIENFKKLKPYILKQFEADLDEGDEQRHPIIDLTFDRMVKVMGKGGFKLGETGHKFWVDLHRGEHLPDGFEKTLLKLAGIEQYDY